MGAVLSFPVPDRPFQVLERPSQEFGAEAAARLADRCRRLLEASKDIVTFVDDDRDAASILGVETIGIEISAILEGGHVDRVADALADAATGDGTARISLDGLDRMERLERLVSEASRQLVRAEPAHLAGSDDDVPWTLFGILTFVGVGALVLAALVTGSR